MGWPAKARLALGACALVMSACSVSNLAFAQDNRVHFDSPRSRQLVSLPVTVAWTVSGFQVEQPGSAPPSRDAGYFALFVDRAPVKPGQSLEVIADKSCRKTPGCFNAEYLAQRGVYTTTSTSLTLQEITAINSYQKVQLHEVTLVLLDTAGKRIGESAWYVDFRMRKPAY